jgi:large conductance mechanosensitive channel
MKTLQEIAASESAKKVYSLWDEFKNFAFKGSVVDLAVGVVIGTAFTGIINSLVKDVIMPTLALFLPSQHPYTEWVLTVGGKSIPYGRFLGEVVNFLLLAAILYLFIVKFLGWIIQARKEEKAAPPEPTKQELLLTEIRDLLARTTPVAPSATPTSSFLTPGGGQ